MFARRLVVDRDPERLHPNHAIGKETGKDQERAKDFSEEKISILKALYDRGEITEPDIADFTEFGAGKESFCIKELVGKGAIYQVSAGMISDENSFAISVGQIDILRRIGVMK